jgi:hypothetical protein
MGRAKDLWFDEMERLMERYIDEGMDEEAAYDKACNNAHTELGDRLADLADRARDEAKYKDVK